MNEISLISRLSGATFKDKHYQTIAEVKVHYDIEKELAAKLRHASAEERKRLYTSVYDELYQRLPNNSMLVRQLSPESAAWVVNQRLQLLSAFLKPETRFLEVGPGDCRLALAVAERVQKVYAVDVTTEFKQDLDCPENFELVISDGCSISVPEQTIDLAYSHQLMEHLHPEDALTQLENIYRSLAPGGAYICITPNRLSGPHDVSKHFDEIASGLHLHEYTVTELYALFRKVGFAQVIYYKSYQNTHLRLALKPASILCLKGLEFLIGWLPYPLRRRVAEQPLLFRGMTLVGIKAL
jgi:SAM-dependent methyltransferase